MICNEHVECVRLLHLLTKISNFVQDRALRSFRVHNEENITYFLLDCVGGGRTCFCRYILHYSESF